MEESGEIKQLFKTAIKELKMENEISLESLFETNPEIQYPDPIKI
jgi:hypothetical protein